MIRVGCHHECSWLHRQQVILSHHPRDSLVVDQHSTPSKLSRDTPVTITATMFQHDLLNLRPDFHVFVRRHFFVQRTIETRPAHLPNLAHALDTQTALHRHQLPDLVVDAFPPETPLLRRRASTFCKAPLKKSVSSVLSASTRFSWRI